jgi:hypothetical protein
MSTGFTVVEEHNYRKGEASTAELQQCLLGETGAIRNHVPQLPLGPQTRAADYRYLNVVQKEQRLLAGGQEGV